MQVTLTKTAEQAVRFANFVREYNVSPTQLAEVIQLYKESCRCKSYPKLKEYKQEIHRRLEMMGFINIYHMNDHITFTHEKTGDSCRLPEI